MVKAQRTFRLLNAKTGGVLAERVTRADGWWERARGLIGCGMLAPDAGLWIDPCNGIHTLGMRYAIDIVFLDKDLRVLRTVCGLLPWRVALPVRSTRSVVELPAGTLSRVALGSGDIVLAEDSRVC